MCTEMTYDYCEEKEVYEFSLFFFFFSERGCEDCSHVLPLQKRRDVGERPKKNRK